jgi:Fe-Mn family superoxide dismutase
LLSAVGLDVWERAYYLHSRNRRPDYASSLFNVINWDAVAERCKKARG